MTPQEASEELKEEFEIFKNSIHKADWDNPNEELRKIIEANSMAIKILGQLDKMRAEIIDTLYVDSLIFGELIDFKNGKISADDVIEEFNRVTRIEVLKIIDKYRPESEVQE